MTTMVLTDDEMRVARILAAEKILQQIELELPIALTDRQVASAVVRSLKRRAALLLNISAVDVDDRMLRSVLPDRLNPVIARLPADTSEDV